MNVIFEGSGVDTGSFYRERERQTDRQTDRQTENIKNRVLLLVYKCTFAMPDQNLGYNHAPTHSGLVSS